MPIISGAQTDTLCIIRTRTFSGPRVLYRFGVFSFPHISGLAHLNRECMIYARRHEDGSLSEHRLYQPQTVIRIQKKK